jgi:hypothetical protein
LFDGARRPFAIVEGLMKMGSVFLPGTVAATMLLGLAGTWRALAQELRNL